ncbi:hypothetical protein SAMN04488082_11511 [Desulfomicrobium apsheronum]|uniref:Uncharacterized protein n=1 Tax=Desulfomicrobium apsheronum TaxID=52560 RepID=A0A1I3X210_9BACT|nr:hypothetical protein [Desulfomicrobium apsheronum]MDY0226725.1 hypothetical protein [Desulfomicrobium apsheronum]SFK13613.1 hypothetical protein SAMN04488082_11511 [Desulfomicrobium apsheronum]
MTDFLNFLRDQIRQVRDIETNAHDLLHNAGDDAGYREAMHRKAELLATLSTNAAPFLDALSLERRPMIEHKLDMFSQSARRSLDIGSVFYMSALLYPDDHKPGEPNTLEIWLAELERSK